jgi:uncharacterized membrane protein YfcA
MLSTTALALAGAVVLFGGLVKGTVGFGYAIASTALLAVFLAPSTAVVLMILPMLAANVTLLRELDRDEFSRCLAQFWPYVLLAMIGTVLGMFLLDVVRTSLLTPGLGLFTLAYVAVKQPWIVLPGERTVARYCFRRDTVVKAALGFVSGIVFGLSNVAVQVVAYLDSLDLDRSTFVGVLAMILVGVSGLRVGMAWTLGLYGGGDLLLYSAGLSVPGVVGVTLGGRLRRFTSDRTQLAAVLLLLSVIGVRLVATGFGIL